MFEPRRSVSDRYVSTLAHPLARFGSQYRIVSLVKPGQRVLDVGCATGYLGAVLRRSKGCYVVGIDIDEEAIQVAAKVLDEAFVWDIEQGIPAMLSGLTFDCVILGDVLEHLRRPDLVLKTLVNVLDEEGLVIAAIPNAVYLTVRLKILLGQFEYQDTGHFDRTHLRFFTRRTARRLFEEAGLEVLRIYPTGPAAILPVWTNLLAAKFVLVGRRLGVGG
jgi:methionine biosynthesis protein MetW